jgi:hypothetical protein
MSGFCSLERVEPYRYCNQLEEQINYNILFCLLYDTVAAFGSART